MLVIEISISALRNILICEGDSIPTSSSKKKKKHDLFSAVVIVKNFVFKNTFRHDFRICLIQTKKTKINKQKAPEVP